MNGYAKPKKGIFNNYPGGFSSKGGKESSPTRGTAILTFEGKLSYSTTGSTVKAGRRLCDPSEEEKGSEENLN